jgi:hypothetical protein
MSDKPNTDTNSKLTPSSSCDDCNSNNPKTTCFWEVYYRSIGSKCIDCAFFIGTEEERYPESCDHCGKRMTSHEGYSHFANNENHCNNCAVILFPYQEDDEDDINSTSSNDCDEQDLILSEDTILKEFPHIQ